MNTQKGQRDKLEKYLNVNQEIEVFMSISGAAVYDFTCFGLDSEGKLSNDAYMIFYNQTQSPNREIRYQELEGGAKFYINLSQLPTQIQKLAFTVSIDGAGNMGMIKNHVVQIRQNNQNILELSLSGADFQNETAVISMEVYQKDVWRFSMTASGFNGGLEDLLHNYGGEAIEETPAAQQTLAQQAPVQPTAMQQPPVQPTAVQQPLAQQTTAQQAPVQPTAVQQAPAQQAPVQPTAVQQALVQQAPVQPTAAQQALVQQTSGQSTLVQATVTQQAGTKISLEKKLGQGAPKLVSLAKPLKVELEKRNLLDCVARVALILDISGSMSERYRNGTVQEIVNKTLPLAVQFDDDGELDFWYYGTTCRRMPSVNMKNYESAVPEDWKKLRRSLGGSNNEVLVMEEVVKEYTGSKLPVYVLFITDGGVSNAAGIKKILKEFSTEPVFWQFVGVGGSNYGILEKLDSMEGRYVDNANFFALDDFRSVSNPELYRRLLNEFPKWLKEIRGKGMIL